MQWFSTFARRMTPVLALVPALLVVRGGLALLEAQDHPPSSAPALGLAAALARADRAAYPNREAAGALRAARGASTQALAGWLPSVRLEGDYIRTTDQLGTFGHLLHQRAVTMEAFDPARLNDPAPSSNLHTGLVMEQPLPLWGSVAGTRATDRALGAMRAQAGWTREDTRLAVITHFYGALLAARHAATLREAVDAAAAHARQAAALARDGMATPSDRMLAEVRQKELEADLAAAAATVGLAKHVLALALGTPEDTAIVLPPSLPEDTVVLVLAARAEALPSGIEQRGDVRAALLGLGAAQVGQAGARAAFLPQIGLFGRLDWNDASRPLGGSKRWTVGLAGRWTLFDGGRLLGGLTAANGRREAAEAMSEGAKAEAHLEAARVASDLAVARVRWRLMGAAAAQSAEAARLVARKYEAGLATIAELLDAAAVSTRTTTGLLDAKYQVLVAAAALWKAKGERLDRFALLVDQAAPREGGSS